MKTSLEVVGKVRALVVVCLLVAGVASDAAAPQGRFSPAPNTVMDNVTGLMWQRGYASGTISQRDTYCQSLNASHFGGYATGWRVPTVRELRSIVDIRANNPAIDTTAFPNTPSTVFWASNYISYQGFPSNVYGVDFNSGGTGTYQTNIGGSEVAHQLRCVR